MPVCSYLVIPEPGTAVAVANRLAALDGCDVTPAENRDVLLLVTDTDGPDRERALRDQLERVEDVLTMVLTFGEIDPDAPVATASARRLGR